MERRQFLVSIGAGAAILACDACFSGCSTQDNPVSPPTNVDFSLDLNAAANAPLRANGGYVYNGGVIVARTSTGSFVAVSQTCTHQGATVEFDVATNRFACPAHGSLFAADGNVVRGPAGSPLARYNTALSGNTLHVYS